MEKQEILKRLDHTLLQQTAVWEQIKVLYIDTILEVCQKQ